MPQSPQSTPLRPYDVYTPPAAKSAGADTVTHGTGSMVDIKPATPVGPQTESLGDAAARMKKEKAAKAASGTKPAVKTLGSFKEGTDYVPKTGIYQLHEGEKVVPKEENVSAQSSAYGDTYLRRKLNAPKDGTPLSGFVKASENKPPRECGNCKWMKDAHCTHPLVMIDPKVSGDEGKPKPVDEDDCCDNFQNK